MPKHARPAAIKTKISNKPGFRPELHGIRGLALGLVVVFHLFANGRVSGGIDIFLAITGFLFTGSLLRRISSNNGRLDFGRHFSRIGYRLLPAALLVITATAIGVYVFFPRTRWLQAANEARASALYHENLELIWSQLTYEAGGPSSSPFQHFWSLSVQGQFHILWPLVIIAAVFIARKINWNAERVTLVVVATIFVASFAYANYLTVTNQEVAYFHTATRMWELALGGLAGLLLPKLRLPSPARVLLGWLGFGLIVTCGLFLDGAANFPGYQALWPISGLILMLMAGHTQSRYGADRLLMTKPFTFVADISYALYLWHWPILVFYLVATERNRASVKGMMFVLVVSVILATVTKRIIEDPINTALVATKNYRGPLIAIAASLAFVGTAGFSAGSYLETKQTQALAQLQVESSEHPGAAAIVLHDAPENYGQQPIPALEIIAKDQPQTRGMDCVQTHRDIPDSDKFKTCSTGDPAGHKTLLILGGSKAEQWEPALHEIGLKYGWKIITGIKGACLLASYNETAVDFEQSDSCVKWNENAIRAASELSPDLVVTLATTRRDSENERTPAGFIEAWERLEQLEIPVLAIRDTPRLDHNVPECISNGGNQQTCGVNRKEVLADDLDGILSNATYPDNVTIADMTHYFCHNDFCPAIAGNIVLYIDNHHVSATYMRTVAPFLESELNTVVPELFR